MKGRNVFEKKIQKEKKNTKTVWKIRMKHEKTSIKRNNKKIKIKNK